MERSLSMASLMAQTAPHMASVRWWRVSEQWNSMKAASRTRICRKRLSQHAKERERERERESTCRAKLQRVPAGSMAHSASNLGKDQSRANHNSFDARETRSGAILDVLQLKDKIRKDPECKKLEKAYQMLGWFSKWNLPDCLSWPKGSKGETRLFHAWFTGAWGKYEHIAHTRQ